MNTPSGLTPNFAPLEEHDAQIVRLGALAEQYFPTDPNTTLLKLRQFAELLAQMTASRVGLLTAPDATFFELLDRLRDEDFLPREVSQLFGELRRVESLFTFADRLEASLATGRTKIENLTPALLAKAFRGELVPQDPTDEPASALLERIRAARESGGGKGKKTVAGAVTVAATTANTGKTGTGKRGRPKKETGGGTLGLGL